jgi:hypothetical protein
LFLHLACCFPTHAIDFTFTHLTRQHQVTNDSTVEVETKADGSIILRRRMTMNNKKNNQDLQHGRPGGDLANDHGHDDDHDLQPTTYSNTESTISTTPPTMTKYTLIDASLDSISTASSTDTESSYSDDTNVSVLRTPTALLTTTRTERLTLPSSSIGSRFIGIEQLQHQHQQLSASPGSVLGHRTHDDVGGAILFPSPSSDSSCSNAGAGSATTSPCADNKNSDDANRGIISGNDSHPDDGLIPTSRRRTGGGTSSASSTNYTVAAVPFVRKRTNSFISPQRQYQFYAFALLVGLTTIASIHKGSTFTVDSNNNDNLQIAEWKALIQSQVPILKKTISKSKHEQQHAFTILLGGGRIDLLQQSLDAMSSCPSVQSINIDYHPATTTNKNNYVDQSSVPGIHIPPSLLSHSSGKVEPAMTSLSQETTTVSSPKIASVATDAVFLLQEGIILSCPELEKGFRTWKIDPSRLVGFFGYRGMNTHGLSGGVIPVESGTGSYAYVADRAVFTHRAYLETLPLHETAVDEREGSGGGCCDDVSLSLKVSLAMGTSPVVLKAKPIDLLEGSGKHRTSTLHRTTKLATGKQTQGWNRQKLSSCNCSPSWLPKHDILSIPHSHSAVIVTMT